eukprot:TRINITY_DN2461_c0_g1_i2.p1 TRINITY_DN2461_c0_g1~~TRINITY_DN2461_c0_g1_i2.p1  ORF type:complete len:471 (-),score=85.91 TRINITY_DN2461_c0_g1_i2:61-1473(-)
MSDFPRFSASVSAEILGKPAISLEIPGELGDFSADSESGSEEIGAFFPDLWRKTLRNLRIPRSERLKNRATRRPAFSKPDPPAPRAQNAPKTGENGPQTAPESEKTREKSGPAPKNAPKNDQKNANPPKNGSKNREKNAKNANSREKIGKSDPANLFFMGNSPKLPDLDMENAFLAPVLPISGPIRFPSTPETPENAKKGAKTPKSAIFTPKSAKNTRFSTEKPPKMPENGRKTTENGRKMTENGDFGSDSDSADRETLLFFGENGAEIENLARARSRKKRENGLFRRPKLEMTLLAVPDFDVFEPSICEPQKTEFSPKKRPERPKSARKRAILRDFAAKMGEIRSKIGENRSKTGENGSKTDKNETEMGKNGSQMGKNGENGSKTAFFGRNWPKIPENRPKSAEKRNFSLENAPKISENGRKSPEIPVFAPGITFEPKIPNSPLKMRISGRFGPNSPIFRPKPPNSPKK